MTWPFTPNVLLSLAICITVLDVRSNPTEAEDLYKKALDIDPLHCNALGNYGLFLLRDREDIEVQLTDSIN
jgi:Tfp pilus assembly protein PilF